MLREAASVAAPPRGATGDDTLEVSVLHELTGVPGLRDEWNALVDRMEPPSPFNSFEWLATWWEHMVPSPWKQQHGRLQIVCFRHRGRLVGLAPFYRKGRLGGTRGLSLLLPLGWEEGRGWSVTEQLEPIFPEPWRQPLLACLGEWLVENRWGMALLPGLHEDDVVPEELQRRTVVVSKSTAYPFRYLPRTWELLVSTLGKSFRDNVKYYPHRLWREGHAVAFTEAVTPEEVTAQLPVLLRLHTLRSRFSTGVAHDDYFAGPRRSRFFAAVAPALAARGQLRVGVLSVDGAPVAAQMWFENRDVMFLYYSGFDPAWRRNSVALVATLEAVKSSMSRGAAQLELLAGLGHFKERWDPLIRERHNLTIAAQPALPRLLIGAASIRRVMRSFS